MSMKGSNDIRIFALSNQSLFSEMGIQQTLQEHLQRVTVLKFNSADHLISASQDRNAFVWQKNSEGVFKQFIIQLYNNNRAVVNANWSQSEKKIVLATGSKYAYIAYFSRDMQWWISKQIKSTIQWLSISRVQQHHHLLRLHPPGPVRLSRQH